VRRRAAAGGETLSRPPAIDPNRPEPPRRLIRGARELARLVGARLLVGLTYVDETGGYLSSTQFCGRVLDVRDGVVVVANPEAREPVVLPAEAAAYSRAASGRYTLRGSGEVVVDPDYLTTWTVVVGGAAPERVDTPATTSVVGGGNAENGGGGGLHAEPGIGDQPQVRSWFAEGEGGWSSEADQ
jgi:hypothetical protein